MIKKKRGGTISNFKKKNVRLTIQGSVAVQQKRSDGGNPTNQEESPPLMKRDMVNGSRGRLKRQEK